MIEDPDDPVAGLGQAGALEFRQGLVDGLAAGPEQGGDGALGEVDLALPVDLIQQQLGHLLLHGAAHQTKNPPLGGLELTQTGDQPSKGDDRVLHQHRQQPVAIEPEGSHLTQGSGGGDVGLPPKHGDVTEDGSLAGAGDHSAFVADGAVQLDLARLDHIGMLSLLALPKEVGARVLVDELAGVGKGGQVAGAQWQIVGPSETPRQPGEMLLVGGGSQGEPPQLQSTASGSVVFLIGGDLSAAGQSGVSDHTTVVARIGFRKEEPWNCCMRFWRR